MQFATQFLIFFTFLTYLVFVINTQILELVSYGSGDNLFFRSFFTFFTITQGHVFGEKCEKLLWDPETNVYINQSCENLLYNARKILTFHSLEKLLWDLATNVYMNQSCENFSCYACAS